MIIKERLEEILNQIRNGITTDVKNGVVVDFNDRKAYHVFLVNVLDDILSSEYGTEVPSCEAVFGSPYPG